MPYTTYETHHVLGAQARLGGRGTRTGWEQGGTARSPCTAEGEIGTAVSDYFQVAGLGRQQPSLGLAAVNPRLAVATVLEGLTAQDKAGGQHGQGAPALSGPR